jgi:hypothetical protein
MFDNNRHDLSDLKIERMLVWKLFVKEIKSLKGEINETKKTDFEI